MESTNMCLDRRSRCCCCSSSLRLSSRSFSFSRWRMAKSSLARSRRWKASLQGGRGQPVSLWDHDARLSEGPHPWPPVLGGAPVSPSAMARALVVKAARRGPRAAVLRKDVRSIAGGWRMGAEVCLDSVFGGQEEEEKLCRCVT